MSRALLVNSQRNRDESLIAVKAPRKTKSVVRSLEAEENQCTGFIVECGGVGFEPPAVPVLDWMNTG